MKISKLRRKKPKFIRQEAKTAKKLGMKWRRPKGLDSKLMKGQKEKGKMPNPGYGSPRIIKGLHPSGFKEILVFSPRDLEGLDASKYACRIGSAVGRKKKSEIMKKAEETKIKILNPLKIKEEIKK